MAKHSAASRPGEAALLRRYRHQMEVIRRDYIEAARNLGLNEVETELRMQARQAESDYRVLSRKFRNDVAKLKRAGLIGKDTDVRSVRPTAGLSKTVNELWDVIAGKRKAVKVSKAAEASLKAEGIKVRRGRAIVSPSYRIDPKTGDVTKVGGLRVIRRIRLGSRIEQQVNELWSQLQPGEYVTFDVWGNSSDVFAATDAGRNGFIARLFGYKPKEVPSVAVVRLPDRVAAVAHETATRKARMTRANEKARARSGYAKAKRRKGNKRNKQRR